MWLTRLREKEKDRWRKKGNREGDTDRQTDRRRDTEVCLKNRTVQSVCTSPRFQYHSNSSPTPQQSVSSA